MYEKIKSVTGNTEGVKMCIQWVIVEYYNVKFFLILRGTEDIVKFEYLRNRIETGARLYMREIFSWCIAQGIEVFTKFDYLKSLPVTANIWNFYNYLRAKSEYKRLCANEVR